MRPLILTNAFLRPRASYSDDGAYVTDDGFGVFACIQEMVDVITGPLAASPVLLPSKFDPEASAALLDRVDGIFLPGAASNLHPSLYGEEPGPFPQRFDRAHDAVDLFLIAEARKRRMPFFGICRSMQAMNIAFGGSLIQKLPVGQIDGQIDHGCSNPCDGRDTTDRFMHDAFPQSGGLLQKIMGDAAPIKVNSMHEQAVGRLGHGLFIEAKGPDGVTEAISLPGEDFFMGVQWHPEALPDHAVSQKLFMAFREAVQRFACRRAS